MQLTMIEQELLLFIETYTGGSLDILYDLADQQWHTYEPLHDGIRQRVETFVQKVIDYNSYEKMENIIFVIGALGLEQSFELICADKDKIKNKDVKRLISEASEEFGDNVRNPYLSLR